MIPVSESAQRLLDDAVQEFARATRFPVAFGGYERAGTARLTALTGNRTLSLHDLRVDTGHGLGGRAMRERRPRLTSDYTRCPHITHDYDHQVAGEGLMALFAMPVVMSGSVLAILYGGARTTSMPGAAFVQAGAAVASELAKQISVEDEVTRRLATQTSTQVELPSALLEELRGEQAELRRIAAQITDPSISEQLYALERRLSHFGLPEAPTPSIRLTPRELDVIAHAALGATNLEIGRSLSLTESTVKSYLKSAMAKLGAPTRHAAVVSARKAHLIA